METPKLLKSGDDGLGSLSLREVVESALEQEDIMPVVGTFSMTLVIKYLHRVSFLRWFMTRGQGLAFKLCQSSKPARVCDRHSIPSQLCPVMRNFYYPIRHYHLELSLGSSATEHTPCRAQTAEGP